MEQLYVLCNIKRSKRNFCLFFVFIFEKMDQFFKNMTQVLIFLMFLSYKNDIKLKNREFLVKN